MVEGDAVDLRSFTSLPSSREAKIPWHLPADRPVIGYVGSLTTQDTIEKGIPEFLSALQLLARHGIAFQGWIVGGPREWVERYRLRAAELGLISLVRFEGQVTSVQVPSALAACDILVYPAPASDHPYFRRDTSPLKLFEYLAARRPIVCADLPPLRDVMDDGVARLCPPGDPASLAEAIADVLQHPEEAALRVTKGWEKVQRHTWEERMGRILQDFSRE